MLKIDIEDIIETAPQTEPKVVPYSLSMGQSQRDVIAEGYEVLGKRKAAELARRILVEGFSKAIDEKTGLAG